MRYRKLDADGDYVLGGAAAFLTNSPEAVAQAVATRLRLIRGEWYLDTTVGMHWDKALGKHTQGAADSAIRTCILGTQGVVEITDYASRLAPDTRAMTVTATITTIYGTTTIQETL
ncbi:hypothetical protein [Pandoraea sputorum]|uniref:hypothetical protein n=1 Tax=Pandoraea sputorum TaxID=93222 RepID=UPI002F41DCFD